MGKTALIILVVLLVLGGIFVFIAGGKFPNPLSKKGTSLGGQIYSQTQNSKDKLPDSNPFAKVNPFKGVYKNPFQ